MLTDRELWACANHVLQQYGDHAALHVAERIGALALDGDVADVETWKAIASRMDQLMRRAESTQQIQ